MTMRNDSEHPYLFRKANVGVRTVPAATVVRLLEIHPVKMAASYVRWLFFIVPGLVFDTIVEPASTFDFPGIHEAAQRPAHRDTQAMRADVMKHEIADAEVPPTETLSGLLFIRPPRLGSTMTLTLINTATHQPVVFEVPTPPPLYVEQHEYIQPVEAVWDAVVKSAAPIQSWKPVSMDKAKGLLIVRTGLNGLAWWMASTMTIAIQPTPDHKTQLTLQSPLRRATTAGYGEHSRTIDRFVQALDARLPQPLPTLQTGPDQPVSSEGSAGERDAPKSHTPAAP
ncbi:MAG: hypothetical protein HYZ89_02290 [Candidatus Omnitrophica bacterium]|nr:hypothetical protein [Candidatus Omnitrophota bacterium]